MTIAGAASDESSLRIRASRHEFCFLQMKARGQSHRLAMCQEAGCRPTMREAGALRSTEWATALSALLPKVAWSGGTQEGGCLPVMLMLN